MVLVDEKFLDTLWRKEDSSWKRPTEQKAKSLLNRELKSDIDNQLIPDDIKVKQYQQHLNRFLHTSRKLPVAPTVDLIDFKEPTVDQLLDLELPKKKKVKKEDKKEIVPVRHSKRKHKKSPWDTWE